MRKLITLIAVVEPDALENIRHYNHELPVVQITAFRKHIGKVITISSFSSPFLTGKQRGAWCRC